MNERASRIFVDILDGFRNDLTAEQEESILQCLREEFERLTSALPPGITPKFWCKTLEEAFVWDRSVYGWDFWCLIDQGTLPMTLDVQN